MSLIPTQSSATQSNRCCTSEDAREVFAQVVEQRRTRAARGASVECALRRDAHASDGISPQKDSVLRTSLGAAIAGGCDIQASSIDRERIARLLDSLKSATLTLLQDASQYKRMSDAGGNPPRSLVSDLCEDLLRVASIRYLLGYVELNQCMRRKPRDDNKRSGLPNADATADRPAARTGRPVKGANEHFLKLKAKKVGKNNQRQLLLADLVQLRTQKRYAPQSILPAMNEQIERRRRQN